MRQSLFILILGFIAGVSYTQHDGFREWVDDSLDVAGDWIGEQFDDAKDAASDSLSDMENKAKKSYEDKFSEMSTELKNSADEVKKTAEKAKEDY